MAAAELGWLAGADRMEGCPSVMASAPVTLTWRTLGSNTYTQGVDPQIDSLILTVSNVEYRNQLKARGRMVVTWCSPRSLVLTIKKGLRLWSVPLLRRVGGR